MILHPAVAHLAPLVGTWQGTGHGSYPTIHDVDYRDEVEFLATSKRRGEAPHPAPARTPHPRLIRPPATS